MILIDCHIFFSCIPFNFPPAHVIFPASYLKKKGVQCPTQYYNSCYMLTPFLKGISQSCTNINQLLHFVRQVEKKSQFIRA